MRGPTDLYWRYKVIEKGVFIYIYKVPPKTAAGQLDTCKKIAEKVKTIKEGPPAYVIVNLQVVIELRELCAKSFENDLFATDEVKAAVKNHRYWINLLKGILKDFTELARKARARLESMPKRKSNQSKKKTNNKPATPASRVDAESFNPFQLLEVEQILNKAVDDQPDVVRSSVSGLSTDPEEKLSMPEEADDKLFRVWCRIQHLASGRDGLFRLLDEVRLGRFCFEGASVICSNIFRQMAHSHVRYAEENPDLTDHSDILTFLNVPVEHMHLPIEQRVLTNREKLLVAESGSLTMACLTLAHAEGATEAMQYAGSDFCRSVLGHAKPFFAIEYRDENSITADDFYWRQMSCLAKVDAFPSYIPFIIEVLSAAHDYFFHGATKIFRNLRRASLIWHGALVVQSLYGIGGDLNIVTDDCGPIYKYQNEDTYDPEEFAFFKTMLITMGGLTRNVKSAHYAHGLATYNQNCIMLAIAHLYCAARSHGLIAKGETWVDMEFFLNKFIPPGSVRNLQDHAYGLGYGKNCDPKSILTAFLLGVGVPKRLLGMDRSELINGIHEYRLKSDVKHVQITPTSDVWILSHGKHLNAFHEPRVGQLDIYHRLFRSETPGMQELIDKMGEHEIQQDDLLNFDLKPLLSIVKGSRLDNGHGNVLRTVAETLNKFAKSGDPGHVRAIWKELVPGIKESGSQATNGLLDWKASVKQFGPYCGSVAVKEHNEGIKIVAERLALLRLSVQTPEERELLHHSEKVYDTILRKKGEIEAFITRSTHEERGDLLDTVQN